MTGKMGMRPKDFVFVSLATFFQSIYYDPNMKLEFATHTSLNPSITN